MKNMIKSALFLAVCASIFLTIVNPALSRQTENKELANVTDQLLALPDGTTDVLFLSPSSYETFWQAPWAFHNAGIASYGLTASGNYLMGYPYEAAQALKTQSPKLIVFDLVNLYKQMNLVDTFNICSTLYDRELFTRFVNRASKELDRIGISYNKTEFYVPFIRFHHNWKNIRTPLSVFLAKHVETLFMGYTCNLFTLEDPVNPDFTKNMQAGVEIPEWNQLASMPRKPLESWQTDILRELLDYCDTLECDVLFIRCPQEIYFSKWSGEWQSAADYVEERGYPVLDAIQYYDEIGLDWTEDYYNSNHTNYYGAIKFTNWLAEYLREHYDLPDRRGDSAYTVWEQEYQRLTEYVRTNTDSNR